MLGVRRPKLAGFAAAGAFAPASACRDRCGGLSGRDSSSGACSSRLTSWAGSRRRSTS